MLRYLFSTLFLLLLCSISCALPSCAGSQERSPPTNEKHVDLFKTGCVIQFDHEGRNAVSQNNKIQNVDNVFFVTTDKTLVAVAEAKYTKNGQSTNTVDFVSAAVEIKNSWDEKIFEGSFDICTEWKAQLATTNAEGAEDFSTVKNVVYNTKTKKIYLLVVNKTSPSYDKWEYNVVVSDDISAGKETAATKWTPKKSVTFDKKTFKLKEEFIKSSLTHGGAFVTKEGKIIFVLRDTNNGKKVIVFVELIEDTSSQELKVLHVEETAENCYPYLFLWNDKIIMITTHCSAGAGADNNVKESSTDITKLKESKGPFCYSYEFLKDKTSFTTADIKGTNVLLFAQQKNGEAGCTGKKCFTFWFSDGNRTYNVGQNIIFEKNENVVSSSIIFVKEKLYFLHQKLEGGNKKFTLTPLDEQLQNITATLDIWKNADDAVLKLCGTEKSEMSCSAPLPTEGLVGFLHHTITESTKKEWKDEYLYVNATITGDAPFQNGLKCNGARQGATWSVGKDGKDQPYNFAKPGFTLVATVAIDGNAESNMFNSILGVALKQPASAGTTNNIGLLCDEHNKFVVNYKTETPLIKTETNCVLGKKYIIALVLKSENLEIYVDGTKLTLLNKAVSINERETIEQFYFGAGSGTPSLQKTTAVTISNVLLYNWPFNNEIEKLKPKQSEKEIVRIQTGSDSTSQQTPKENTDKTGTQPDTSVRQTATEKEDKQSSSPPPTTEDSAVRVGVVGVLSLFFDVFTLLGRYVY